MKNNKGITLVALVVTIVVLLILAGVSINLVLGDNGIVKKAQDAKTKSAEASENDLKGMNGLIEQMESSLNGGSSDNKEDDGLGKLVNDMGTLPEDTTPYFPSSDFKRREKTNTENGLVIEDTEGNEYVWVVVPKSLYNNTAYNSNNAKKPSSSTDYANIEYCLQQYTATYRNGTSYSDVYYADNKNVDWFADETAYNNLKNNMLKSVYENGGFYVGRYEAGIAENRTSNTDKNSDGKYTIEGMPLPVTKADAYPYTYVTRTQAQNLASNVNSGTKTSSLMFGVQWDLMLAFMSKDTAKITSTDILTKNSITIGNYYNSTFDLNRGKYAQYGKLGEPWNNFDKALGSIVVSNETTGKMKKTEQSSYSNGILLTTGGTEQSKIMNIYDVAGNVWEWTLEWTSGTGSPCATSGGDFSSAGSDIPAVSRCGLSTDGSFFYFGFRVSLF